MLVVSPINCEHGPSLGCKQTTNNMKIIKVTYAINGAESNTDIYPTHSSHFTKFFFNFEICIHSEDKPIDSIGIHNDIVLRSHNELREYAIKEAKSWGHEHFDMYQEVCISKNLNFISHNAEYHK